MKGDTQTTGSSLTGCPPARTLFGKADQFRTEQRSSLKAGEKPTPLTSKTVTIVPSKTKNGLSSSTNIFDEKQELKKRIAELKGFAAAMSFGQADPTRTERRSSLKAGEKPTPSTSKTVTIVSSKTKNGLSSSTNIFDEKQELKKRNAELKGCPPAATSFGKTDQTHTEQRLSLKAVEKPTSSTSKTVTIVSSKTRNSPSSSTSVFDENQELKKRIAELENEISLSASQKNMRKEKVTLTPDGCGSGGGGGISGTPTRKKEVTLNASPITPRTLGTPIKDMNRNDRKWFDMYGQLVEFQRQHKHTMVPVAWPGLGTWVSRQRRVYKEGRMDDDRKALLQELDFVWVAK
jgi:uncharacterized protein YdcH (DUF465 family)